MKTKKIVSSPIREEVVIRKVASKSVVFATACVFLILGIGLTAGYFIVKELKYQGETTEQKEIRMTMDKVGRLVVLPTDTPTLATVTDKTKLMSQPFFKNAENGDKVLFFSISKKAILYRPSVGKIVEIGPIVPNVPTAVVTESTITPTATPTPTKKK